MTKHIFNILSASSFALSGGIIASGVYVYANREAIIDEVKAQVVEYATEAITVRLPEILDGSFPELPEVESGVPTGELPTTLPSF